MIACKNCQTEFEGKHCPNCGQKAKVKRITSKQVWEDTRQSLFHYDSGFFYTLFQLVKRPGHAVRDYLEGKRVVHVKPIKFLIWASALNFLLFHLLGLDTELAQQMSQGRERPALQMKIMELVFQHPTVILLFMLPCLALISWLFFRRNGQYNFAENFVLNSYLLGANNMIGLITSPLLKLMGTSGNYADLKIGISLVIYVLYFGWAYDQFFQPRNKWAGWLKSLCVILIGYALMIVTIMILALIFFAFMATFFKGTLQEWFPKN